MSVFNNSGLTHSSELTGKEWKCIPECVCEMRYRAWGCWSYRGTMFGLSGRSNFFLLTSNYKSASKHLQAGRCSLVITTRLSLAVLTISSTLSHFVWSRFIPGSVMNEEIVSDLSLWSAHVLSELTCLWMSQYVLIFPLSAYFLHLCLPLFISYLVLHLVWEVYWWHLMWS